mmetsp:Transcript_9023/g.16266  ORF Transcript_9023/g.16266 Transcript_9023/m.16266 type:complete len:287 (-) Transcript_9023:629-1489(-)
MFLEIRQSGAHATTRHNADARVDEAHLRRRERAQQHHLVHVTEVSDAKHLVLHLRQSHSERHIVLAVSVLHDSTAIHALWHLHHRQAVAVPARVGAQELQPPRLRRLPRPSRQSRVPFVHVPHPLSAHQRDRLAQAVQQWKDGGVGHAASRVGGQHVAKVIIHFLHLRRLVRLKRLVGDTHKAEAGGQGQRLLGAGDRAVDAPLVKLKLATPDRRDAVNEEHRGMTCGVDGIAAALDVAGHTGGGLIVHHAHGLVLMLGVGLQNLLNLGLVRAITPAHVNASDVQP